MKLSAHSTHKNPSNSLARGFTLMETVIAILVLAILLTGFLTVFTPAAQGIRRSISSQQADRLKATLERDMSTLRTGESTADIKTGFDKAFKWIQEGHSSGTAIFVYQYRGDKSLAPRTDGTMQPMSNISGEPGVDYITQTSARRANDPLFSEDLYAIVGPLFYVIPTQLISVNNELILGTPGQIANPNGGIVAANPSEYTDAVITFSAAFHMTPSVSQNYIQSNNFSSKFTAAADPNSKIKPVFIRNLAVRR
jgi:prepilin-type N-terminal cleavage/methylation domain-containing protein